VSDGRKALIPKPAFDIRQSDPGAEKVLSGIVSDFVKMARGRDVARAPVRIRIGKYEFREQDYRQIVIWARETGKSPEELVSLLEQEKGVFDDTGSAFIIDDGSIRQIAFPKNPIFPRRILRISDLPKLVKLDCGNSQLTELDLSNVPALIWLICHENQLVEIDLSNVPALRVLVCANNQLREVALSNVPALDWLWCNNNQLTELDLSNVPALTQLSFGENQLTELDLSKVTALTNLNCSNNQLTELDLSKVRR
jgi:Leucine-rich repeat (LRR) protein